MRAREATLLDMAARTMGKYYDPVTKDNKLLTILQEEVGNYYLLGFLPAKDFDEKHSIRVEVKDRPDLKVSHRLEYKSSKNLKTTTGEKKIYIWKRAS